MRIFFWTFIAALVVFYLSQALLLPARAHQAASGWAYPPECCSNQDCKEFPATRMKETPDGYRFPSGVVIPYTDRRIMPSPDGKHHICQNSLRVICLFVPPGGM